MMHYTFINTTKEDGSRKYKVDFSVKYFDVLSEKDKEKIYKVIRIMNTLGDDKEEETSDEDYRFRTDDDDGKQILDGVVEDCTKEKTEDND